VHLLAFVIETEHVFGEVGIKFLIITIGYKYGQKQMVDWTELAV
jgi:hypothetical protein